VLRDSGESVCGLALGKEKEKRSSGAAEERRSGGAEERRSGGAEERRSGVAEVVVEGVVAVLGEGQSGALGRGIIQGAWPWYRSRIVEMRICSHVRLAIALPDNCNILQTKIAIRIPSAFFVVFSLFCFDSQLF